MANSTAVEAVAEQPCDLHLTLPTGLFCLHTAHGWLHPLSVIERAEGGGVKSMADLWHCSQDSDRSPVCWPPLPAFLWTPLLRLLPPSTISSILQSPPPQPLLSDWHLKGGRGQGRRRCSTLWKPLCKGTAGDICREAHKRQLKACACVPSFSSSPQLSPFLSPPLTLLPIYSFSLRASVPLLVASDVPSIS